MLTVPQAGAGLPQKPAPSAWTTCAGVPTSGVSVRLAAAAWASPAFKPSANQVPVNTAATYRHTPNLTVRGSARSRRMVIQRSASSLGGHAPGRRVVGCVGVRGRRGHARSAGDQLGVALDEVVDLDAARGTGRDGADTAGEGAPGQGAEAAAVVRHVAADSRRRQ